MQGVPICPILVMLGMGGKGGYVCLDLHYWGGGRYMICPIFEEFDKGEVRKGGGEEGDNV